MNSFPLTQDLVLIGGGHTHALLLRRWGMQALPGVRVTLINPGPVAIYSGMLPGFVAGHYRRDELEIDLYALCHFAGARLIDGAVTGIDRVARTLAVPGRPAIGYDVASFDIGATSDLPDLPGFADHAVAAKPLGRFASRWAETGQNVRHVCVIGGGVAGAELAMAVAHRQRGPGAVVHLIDRGRVLATLGAKARVKALAALSARGVMVLEQAMVTAITATGVDLADGRTIPSDFTIGAAGAKAQDWLTGTGLALQDGFITVDRALRTSDPAIFAVGDCAHMAETPRPKAGVFAVRQAPVLFDNLRAVLSGAALRRFRPQRDYLRLIALGDRTAVADKWGQALAGPLLWRLKDRIDRAFIARFQDLPVMAGPEVPGTVALGLREALGDKPLCGGCGSKVGRGALRRVLSGLPVLNRPDIIALPGDDAALLLTGTARQVISTDHLHGITADPALLARIAAVHALGDIWAMGAAPQAATAMIILPRMSEALQRRTLAEIMAVATEVMGTAGAAIVGGHTAMGAELTLGFTVTGLCDREPLTLAGAKAGDAIILTKPLGSGVILAGAMQGKVRGADVAACHAAMVQPQGAAAAILRDAHAMTDVTGFGLLGHLSGICDASGVAARVDLAAVPLMPGALRLAQAGVRSTIWAENRRLGPKSGPEAGPESGPEGPALDLLSDPQTAGGLLAAVGAVAAGGLLAKLEAAGYQAAIIGHFKAGPAAIRVE